MTGQPPMTLPADAQDEAAAVAAAVGPAPLPLVYLGHDLRAALAEMRCGLHVVHTLNLPPEVQDTISRCIAAGENLSRLIDQSVLVCLGRSLPGLQAPEEIASADWTRDLRLRLAGLARHSDHRFALDCAGPLPAHFAMDRTALDRIVTNLVLNAFRHTPPGEVRIELACGNAGAQSLEIRVVDSGPGFAPDVLQALCNGRPLRDDHGPAESGFGLQSVLYLVQAMGGQCRFDNPAGGGAEVRLSLPFGECPPQPAADLPLAPEALALLRGVRVLLVDDSATSRAAIQAEIASLGMVVTEASDGMQTIRQLGSGGPLDLLLLDDQLPELTGLEVLHWIKARLALQHRPAVVIITAHAEPARVAALTEAGAARVLTKPVLDVRRLAPLLVEVLQSRKRDAATEAMATRPDLAPLYRLARMAGPVAAQELFDKLGEDLDTARAGLARATRDRDLAAIRKHSHVLIALAGTAGASDLHDDAVRLNGLAQTEAATERTVALAGRLDGQIAELCRRVSSVATHAVSMTVQP